MQAIRMPPFVYPSYWGWGDDLLARHDRRALKICAAVAIAILTLSLNFYKVACGSIALTFLHTLTVIHFSSKNESRHLSQLKIRRIYQIITVGLLVAGTALAMAGIGGVVHGAGLLITCWKSYAVSWCFLEGVARLTSVIGVVFAATRHLFQAASQSQRYVDYCAKKIMKPLKDGFSKEFERIIFRLRLTQTNLEEVEPILEHMDPIDVKEFFEQRIAILSFDEITKWMDRFHYILTPQYLLEVLNDDQIEAVLLPKMKVPCTIEHLEHTERELEVWQKEMKVWSTSHVSNPSDKLAWCEQIGSRIAALTKLSTNLEIIDRLKKEIEGLPKVTDARILEAKDLIQKLASNDAYARLYSSWSLRMRNQQPLYQALIQLQTRLKADLDPEDDADEDAVMTLSYLGFRESDYGKLANTWGLISDQVSSTKLVSDYLKGLGLENKRNLIDAKVLSEKGGEDVKAVSENLLKFVKARTRFSIFSVFKKAIASFSTSPKWSIIASSIYEYVVSLGLFFVQLVHNPITTSVGFLYGMHLNIHQQEAPYIIEKFRVFRKLNEINPTSLEGWQIEHKARHLAVKIASLLFSQYYMGGFGFFYLGVNHADMISRHFRSWFYQARAV